MKTTEILLYVTVGTMEQAESIGAFLIEEHLAACINIFSGMRSIYRWKGKLESSDEFVLLVKTREELSQKATDAIVRLHEFELPCVMALPVVGGNKDFLQWIHHQTA